MGKKKRNKVKPVNQGANKEFDKARTQSPLTPKGQAPQSSEGNTQSAISELSAKHANGDKSDPNDGGPSKPPLKAWDKWQRFFSAIREFSHLTMIVFNALAVVLFFWIFWDSLPHKINHARYLSNISLYRSLPLVTFINSQDRMTAHFKINRGGTKFRLLGDPKARLIINKKQYNLKLSCINMNELSDNEELRFQIRITEWVNAFKRADLPFSNEIKRLPIQFSYRTEYGMNDHEKNSYYVVFTYTHNYRLNIHYLVRGN